MFDYKLFYLVNLLVLRINIYGHKDFSYANVSNANGYNAENWKGLSVYFLTKEIPI